MSRRTRLSMFLLCLLVAACGHMTPELRLNDAEQPLPPAFELIPINESTTSRWYFPVYPPPSPTETEPYDYILGPGDVITLILYVLDTEGQDSLKRIIPAAASLQAENQFLIHADGTIHIPFAGRLHLAGLPFHQARQKVSAAIREYFVDPQIEMRVSTFAHGQVLISGEVANPQMMPLGHQPLLVMDAIARAGGVLPTADLKHSFIEREDAAIIPVNLERVLYHGDDRQNRILRSGDVLSIPRHHGNRIFVMGEVIRPQTVTLHPAGASLTEVISEAAGVDFLTGDSSQIYVIRGYIDRPEKNGIKAPYPIFHLNASNPSHWVYADRFRLQPRDIIYVGTQEITAWNRFIIQLLPTAISQLINRNNFEQ